MPCTLKPTGLNGTLHFTVTYLRAYFAGNFVIFAWVNARVDAASKTKGNKRGDGNIFYRIRKSRPSGLLYEKREPFPRK